MTQHFLESMMRPSPPQTCLTSPLGIAVPMILGSLGPSTVLYLRIIAAVLGPVRSCPTAGLIKPPGWPLQLLRHPQGHTSQQLPHKHFGCSKSILSQALALAVNTMLVWETFDKSAAKQHMLQQA